MITSNNGLIRFLSFKSSSKRSKGSAALLDSSRSILSQDIIHESQNLRLVRLCKKYPNTHKVISMAEKYPDSLHARNSIGQTPLHVATSHALSAEIIIYLLYKYPEASSVVDTHGKSPLHYAACQSYWTVADAGVFDDTDNEDQDSVSSDSLLDPHYKDILKALAKSNPTALGHEDKSGRNPIEYAILYHASLDVIKSLQRTSVNCWRQGVSQNKSPLSDRDLHEVAGRSA